MTGADLAQRIQSLQPEASPSETSRVCLMLFNQVDDFSQLEDDQFLYDAWADITMRLQAATDQHEAMAHELHDLAKSDPRKFSPEQIWILVRAIKVQSQVLQMYHTQKSFELS